MGMYFRFRPRHLAARGILTQQKILAYDSKGDPRAFLCNTCSTTVLGISPIAHTDLPTGFFQGYESQPACGFQGRNLFPGPHVQDRHIREISWLSFRNVSSTNYYAALPVLFDHFRIML